MHQLLRDWFEKRNWKVFPFQEKAVKAYRNGGSGLIHAPTGMGKTYGAWLGALDSWLEENPDQNKWPKRIVAPRVLWITPLRALANDTMLSLRAPVEDLGLPWSIEKRTGDISSTQKRNTLRKPPSCLVTTPESLSLILTQEEWRDVWKDLECVVVDEWHELLGNKRGVQSELCLARLRHAFPNLRLWGVSATLGDIEIARDVLLGDKFNPKKSFIIKGELPKQIEIETLRPQSINRFPWAGHLGLNLLPQVIKKLKEAKTTLLFTNTRSQSEMWYQALSDQMPEWNDVIALHHGSLDRELRNQYEEGLKNGELRCVVCTSSLDLGVDFSPVDQVIQVGSPKGIARLMQRAGRSGHQPGQVSRIICVPTHSFELVEFAAVRDAVDRMEIESRIPLKKPLDVLIQHIISMSIGGGFESEDMFREVAKSWSFRELTKDEWDWILRFVTHGGESLKAYEQYARVVKNNNQYHISTDRHKKLHKMMIGTISSYQSVRVKFQRGGTIGTVEEAFIGRMKPGDKFMFGGKTLELVRFKDMTAYVRVAKSKKGAVPRWMGGRMPLSSELASAVRRKIREVSEGDIHDPESECIAPLLEIQRSWSIVPKPNEFLIEKNKSRDGYHYFFYSFAGRLVNEGLGPFLTYRISKKQKATFSIAQNDYGIELLTPVELKLDESDWDKLLTPENLIDDLLETLISTELPKYQFREIARIAGLVFEGYPSARKTTRQLQMSSNLIYDVFKQFEPDNLLLDQARREVLDRQMEVQRMKETLEKIQDMNIIYREPKKITPFAFPIMAERIRHQVSTESWEDRITRMVNQLEKAAEKETVSKV